MAFINSNEIKIIHASCIYYNKSISEKLYNIKICDTKMNQHLKHLKIFNILLL